MLYIEVPSLLNLGETNKSVWKGGHPKDILSKIHTISTVIPARYAEIS